MNRLIITLALVVLAGCAAPTPIQVTNPVEHQTVRLIEFRAVDNATDAQVLEADGPTVSMQATPKGMDPADYGANTDGEVWVDGIITAKSYALGKGAGITTHTHGIVIYANTDITIDGRVNVHGLGAEPNETGYDTSRAGTMALYHGYGYTDADTGEPRLWGSGGQDCSGGGYIVLNAPTITLNGDLDAGTDCDTGQAGIVILEGNVSGAGTIEASMIIHRGNTP